MLKLKLQYFGHLMRRVDSLEKTLMLGGIGGRRKRGRQRMRWLDGITDSMDWVWVNSGSWWWTGRPGVLRFMGSQKVGHDWATELTDWRQTNFSSGCQWLSLNKTNVIFSVTVNIKYSYHPGIKVSAYRPAAFIPFPHPASFTLSSLVVIQKRN